MSREEDNYRIIFGGELKRGELKMKGDKGEERRRKIFDFLKEKPDGVANSKEISKMLKLPNYPYWVDVAEKMEKDKLVKIDRKSRPVELSIINLKYISSNEKREEDKPADKEDEEPDTAGEEDKEEDVKFGVDDIEDGTDKEEEEVEKEEIEEGTVKLTSRRFMKFLESKGGEMTLLDVLDDFDTDDTEIMGIAKEFSDKNMIHIQQQGKGKPVKFITRVGPIAKKCAHPDCPNLAVKGGAFCVECNLKDKEKHKSDVDIVEDEEEEQEDEESEELDEEEKSDKEEQAVVDEMIKRSPDDFDVDEEAAASWAKHQEIIGAVYIFAFKEGKESMRARISCIVPRHAL